MSGGSVIPVMLSGSMLAGCHASVWQMLDIPQESKVVLFLLYCYGCIYKKPHPPKTYRLAQTGKGFLLCSSLHSLEQPEGSKGCHSLNGQEPPGAGMLLYGKFTGITYKG